MEGPNVHRLSKVGAAAVVVTTMLGAGHSARAADATADVPRIAVSGPASALYIERSLLVARLPVAWQGRWKEPEHLCTDFHLRAFTPQTVSVTLSVVGLGTSTLAVVPVRDVPPCDADGSSGVAILNLEVGMEMRRVRVRVPTAVVPEPGASVDGKVAINSAGMKPLEIPLKLSAPGQGSFTTAVLWFLGLAIPASLAFFTAQATERLKNFWSSRQKEHDQWEAYRREQFEALNGYFNEHYPRIAARDVDQFVRELDRDLRDRNVVREMPRHIRLRLLGALHRGTRKKVTALLARAFPEWQLVIYGQRG